MVQKLLFLRFWTVSDPLVFRKPPPLALKIIKFEGSGKNGNCSNFMRPLSPNLGNPPSGINKNQNLDCFIVHEHTDKLRSKCADQFSRSMPVSDEDIIGSTLQWTNIYIIGIRNPLDIFTDRHGTSCRNGPEWWRTQWLYFFVMFQDSSTRSFDFIKNCRLSFEKI